MDLLNEINSLSIKLTEAIKIMAKYGKELAETEKNYKIILCQEALKLRADKEMAVTLIDKVVYGLPEVADKKFKRDVAKSMYETAKENINVMKKNLDVLKMQYEKEWGSSK